MTKIAKILLSILLFWPIQLIASQCHYSCYTCNGQSYTNCILCFNNQSASLDVTAIANKTYGTCSQIGGSLPNLLGIFLYLISFVACVLLINQKIYYFVLIIQNLGLLFFMDIYWTPPVDYILESFSLTMIFSSISSPLKTNGINLSRDSRYKSILFLKNANLKSPFILIITALLIIIPIYKVCRQLKIKQRNLWFPDWMLDKLVTILITLFIFQIQQLTLVIMICLTEGFHNDAWDYIILSLYIIIIILFFLNVCYLQLPYFRNKTSQQMLIFSKIIGPIFILGNNKTQFVFYIYMFILIFWQIIITNQNPDPGQINRLFFYKFAILLTFLSTLLYYILETKMNNEKISKIFGIFNIVLLGIIIYLFLLQICFSFKENYCQQTQITGPSENTQQNTEQQINDIKITGKIHPTLDNLSISQNLNISTENLNILMKSSRNGDNQNTISNDNIQLSNIIPKRKKNQFNKNQKQQVDSHLKTQFQKNAIVHKHLIENNDIEFFIPQLPNYAENQNEQNQQVKQITYGKIQLVEQINK